MGQIRANPDTLRQRAGQTDKQAEAVQNVINAMDRLLKQLNTEWEGEAMRGYEARYNNIKPSFKNAKILLEEMAHNLRATADIIERTDAEIGRQTRG